MDYILHIFILVLLYAILASSLNLVAGFAGILSLAQAAFFGLGAYVAGIMGVTCGTSFLVNCVCAIVLCGALGILVGWPSLRIRGDYFVIATFAFQVIAFNVFNNCVTLTGGPLGLPGIPRPRIFGWCVTTHVDFVVLTGSLFCASSWLVRRIGLSPFGRVLRGIREDEVLAETLGKNVAPFKVVAFVVSAALSGVAGVLYAHYITFIDPTSFTVMESVFIISLVIVGGAGSLWGPVLGAVVLVTLPELLRFVGIPSAAAANIRQILYGIALVACMLWRPQGLIGEYAFGREAKPK